MLTKQKYDGTLSEEIVTPLTHDPLHQTLSHSPSYHRSISTCSTLQGHLSITLLKKAIRSRFWLMDVVIFLLFITLYLYYYSWFHLLQSTVYSPLPLANTSYFFSVFLSSTASSSPRGPERDVWSGEGCIEPWRANRVTSHLSPSESHSLYRLLCSVSGQPRPMSPLFIWTAAWTVVPKWDPFPCLTLFFC